MTRTRQRLDEALARQVVAYIRQGVYPHVAAEAAGIPIAVYEDWLRKGEGPRARGVYRQFAAQIRQASAQARVLAEAHVWKKEPKLWLGRGPGKHTAARPGWTREVSAAADREQAAADRMALLPILYTLLDFIDPWFAEHPELREGIRRKAREAVPELVPGPERAAPGVQPPS